jgi:hypothetical protein
MAEEWPDGDYEYRVGTDHLSEFAAGHSAADVLRELVQNEYDAGGSHLEVRFDEHALMVRGNGEVIDAAGWNRLSVMLGTGLVAGTSMVIQKKVNGIGSKNFGLRSLFLFGDSIGVASGGQRTVLDRRRGSLRSRIPDEPSGSSPGVALTVPYRTTDDGDLRIFDERREHDALSDMAAALAPTLVKLAKPGSTKGISAVTVTSTRLNHRLTWVQSVRTLKERGSPLLRTVRLEHQGDSLGDVPTSFKELEYARLCVPPTNLRGRPIPSYFRRPGGRIRLGVSFATRGRRVVASAGYFYYPIGAMRARTGAQFSVSAPFAMNEDRSNLLDPVTNNWNAWLIDEVASFVVDLLPEVLFDRFGASAYSAVQVVAKDSSAPRLATSIEKHLANRPCWPSRTTIRKRIQYAVASTLTVPIEQLTDVASVLRAQSVVHDAVSTDAAVRDMVLAAGAKPFTANSLVRLRCAGTDATSLRTSDPGGAGWHFTNFPEALANLKLQVQMATALDRVPRQLTQANRHDLKTAPTTLTSAAVLAAPDEPLWIVDEALTAVVPPEKRLHPALTATHVVGGLCKRFEPSRWVIETARMAAAGQADDIAMSALRNYLLQSPDLSQKAWAAARQAPVLLDHRGNIAAASDLVRRSAPGAAILESILSFPPSWGDENKRLVERLRIRNRVIGDDLVRFANAVTTGAVPLSQMRIALERHRQLLTPAVVKQLAQVEFLETTTGGRVAPSAAYERNARTLLALGDAHPWPTPSYGKLVSRLKCRTEPSVNDTIRHLLALQDAGLPLPQAEAVYRLLHELAKAERRRLEEFSTDSVIWTGREWAAPYECLLGADHSPVFGTAVPVLVKPREAFLALGVPTRPTADHWRRLFDWARQQATGGRVSRRVREVLLRAYEKLDAIPPEIPSDWPVILDDRSQLHSKSDAARLGVVIDDYPLIATELRGANAKIAFAFPDPLIAPCLESTGVRRLSEIARIAGITPGPKVEDAELSVVPKLLARLADPDFASAAAALAAGICGPSNALRPSAVQKRLQAIRDIDVTEHIRRHYRVGSTTVTTSVDHYVDFGRVIVAKVRTQEEVRRAVARAVASIIEPGTSGAQGLPDALYFLMRCVTAAQLERELQQRNIRWAASLSDLPAPNQRTVENDSDVAEHPDTAALADAIRASAIAAIDNAPPIPTPAPAGLWGQEAPHTPQRRQSRRELPLLGDVRPSFIGAPQAPRTRGRTADGGTSAPDWTPRTPEDTEADRQLGCRGEQLVFDGERRRVAARGQNPNEVVWIAATQPAANHDIRSLDVHGRETWLEVKSTASQTGRFSWPKAEFQLAVSKRRQYFLYRVYKADTTTPVIVEVQDPIGWFENGRLTLDLDVLAADIGEMDQPGE